MSDTISAPQQDSAPQVGLIGERIGSFASSSPGSVVFPSSIGETLDWLGTTKQIARASGNAQAEFGAIDDYGRSITAPEPSVPADELQQRFGIPGKLKFDNPLPASVAQSMYDAKRDEIAREDALSRRPSGLGPGAAQMGAGLIAGLLDPVNVAAAFVPGVDEARFGALFGESALGTVASRATAGAVSGAVGQIPLVALRYGLSQQEQADYDAWSAMSDLAMGAGIGGVLHPLAGAVGDALGQRFARTRAAAIVADDPGARLDTLKTAIAQTVEERPVEVQPVLDAAFVSPGSAPEDLAAEMRPGGADALEPAAGDLTTFLKSRRAARPVSLVDFLIERGGVRDQGGDLSAMDADLIHHRQGGRLVSPSGMPLDYAREAAAEAGYLPHDSTVADLLDRIADAVSGRNSFRPEDQAMMEVDRASRRAEAEQGRYDEARSLVQGLAEDHGIEVLPDELHQAAILTMQGVHPEDALIDATRGMEIEAGATFDRALDAATGKLGPLHEVAQQHAPDAAKVTPDQMMAVARQQIADHEEFLRRADEAGALSEVDRAEFEEIGQIEPQALSLGQAFLQAAACILRGLR
jgi:hypothetical protein